MQNASLKAIYRYPVKGLGAELLERVDLAAGETLPLDRSYAIENGSGGFDPLAPKYLPKTHFVMLMRNERLAALETHFDEVSHTLTIRRDGKQVARGMLSAPIGRAMIEQFLAAYMGDDLRGAPKIVQAKGHSFSDVSAKCLHIINLESVRELTRLAGREVDPGRFRANLVIDGIEAKAELDWLDREISIGPVRAKVFARTSRCAATDVDPATGERDMAIPSLLERSFSHTDFGVYARVLTPGSIEPGVDIAAIIDTPAAAEAGD